MGQSHSHQCLPQSAAPYCFLKLWRILGKKNQNTKGPRKGPASRRIAAPPASLCPDFLDDAYKEQEDKGSYDDSEGDLHEDPRTLKSCLLHEPYHTLGSRPCASWCEASNSHGNHNQGQEDPGLWPGFAGRVASSHEITLHKVSCIPVFSKAFFSFWSGLFLEKSSQQGLLLGLRCKKAQMTAYGFLQLILGNV